MRVFSQISALRSALEPMRASGEPVALVPTMGALHEGHLALIRQAQAECRHVVVSIFVNPKQFGPNEDFDAYPRRLEADIALLERENVTACFAPEIKEMWPEGNETIVETVNLSHLLLGALRPGHFRGVTSVVAKLFNIVQPQCAYFGEKDFQQLTIIQRMVDDLAFPVKIVAVPTLRDTDGVALSSRNALLSPEDRLAARIIPRALAATSRIYNQGEREATTLINTTTEILSSEPRAMIDSVDLRDCATLKEVTGSLSRPAMLLLTVRFGQVRLIDQLRFDLNTQIAFGQNGALTPSF